MDDAVTPVSVCSTSRPIAEILEVDMGSSCENVDPTARTSNMTRTTHRSSGDAGKSNNTSRLNCPMKLQRRPLANINSSTLGRLKLRECANMVPIRGCSANVSLRRINSIGHQVEPQRVPCNVNTEVGNSVSERRLPALSVDDSTRSFKTRHVPSIAPVFQCEDCGGVVDNLRSHRQFQCHENVPSADFLQQQSQQYAAHQRTQRLAAVSFETSHLIGHRFGHNDDRRVSADLQEQQLDALSQILIQQPSRMRSSTTDVVLTRRHAPLTSTSTLATQNYHSVTNGVSLLGSAYDVEGALGNGASRRVTVCPVCGSSLRVQHASQHMLVMHGRNVSMT